MKCQHIFLFFVLTGALLHTSMYATWARVPQTPKIVFSSINDEQNSDIYLMNPDGTGRVRLTRNKAFDVSPMWSPTGGQILFASSRDGVRDLYFMDADGTNVKRVFGKSVYRNQPTWSPNGKQIAYTRREQGKWFIYIAPIDSQKEERIAIGGNPVWSPDGTEIAFLIGWPDRMQINLLNVHTLRQKGFFPKEAIPSWIGSAPAWSPTRNRIAFSWLHRVPLGRFLDTETIYIVNRDGMGKPLQIIGEAGPKVTSPIWSPSGESLLYEQLDENGRKQIFKIALNSGESVQLTPPGSWNSLGDWFDPDYALPVAPRPHLLTTTWAAVKQEDDP